MRKAAIFSIVLTLICLAAHAGGGVVEHFNRAMSLYDSKMWGVAGVEFTKARAAITQPEDPLTMRCDYMVAMCAWAAGDDKAYYVAEQFLLRYPHTIYHNDVTFVLGCELYKGGEWNKALASLLSVDPLALDVERRQEYNFILGHSYFLMGDNAAASRALAKVDTKGQYGPSATYYLSYIEYTQGNYAAAKQGFASLSMDPAYGRIVPFYLLQIEFLQNNYSYVTANADPLIASATKPRAAEIARLAAESWYHLQDHTQSLRYMELFRRLGGEMGRQENYIEGYCYYVVKDYDAAAARLGLVVSADDALSQNAGYHLAACYLAMGRKREAMQSFSIASVGRYDETVREDALFNYGKLQYELGGGIFNEAINVLNRYIKEYPGSPRVSQAREYLLAAYYNSRNYEAAYDAIMLIPNPDNNVKAALQKITYFRALEQYNAGDLVQADRMLMQSSANRYNSKYTALALFWRGEIAYQAGNYAGAIPLYREFITLSPADEPEHATAHYSLAYSYFSLKKWTEAGTWFDRYMALRPTDNEHIADTYNRLGDIKYSAHSFWTAIEEYDKAAKPGTAQRFYSQWRRAVLLGMVDRTPRKIETLQDIVKSGQGEYVDDALYELGRTYMGQDNFSAAAQSLTRYIDTYPTGASSVDALGDLALINQNMGNSDQALDYYKKIVITAPNSPQAKDAMIGIRSIYVDRNQVDSYFAYAATTGMETDLSSVQRDSLSFASAERQYLTASNMTSGATALRGYLSAFPKGAYRAQALYDLGDASTRVGDRTGALKAYEELTAMYHNDYTVRGLEHFSRIQEDNKNYPAAMSAFLKLSRTATAPPTINRALEGYLRTAMNVPAADMKSVVNEIIESPFADKNVIRQAQFAKAKLSEPAQALAIYEKLGTESQTVEGAESTFRVIEAAAAAGNNADAKKRIFAMADQNSPHTYWMGRAFLTLGDIYTKEGDTFQARATFQSIVDGYPANGDGIAEKARESIKNLK